MCAFKVGKRNEKNKLDKLDNLIHAIECENWHPLKCEHCPYGYQYWDDSGDHGFWFHNDEKVLEDTLYYLKFLKENLVTQKL